jgi:uncharacterized phage-associated protein
MYSALKVARYIIWWCNNNGYSISNLKLQKILYFVQAQFLVARGMPCFCEEIQAWEYGPVVPEVYREYKAYGGGNIPAFERSERPMVIRAEDIPLIDDIISECVNYSASSLVELTHNQSPWQDVYMPGWNNTISNASIKKYFSEE